VRYGFHPNAPYNTYFFHKSNRIPIYLTLTQ